MKVKLPTPSMDQIADALTVLELAGVCNWQESVPTDTGTTFFVEFYARKVDVWFDENDTLINVEEP